MNLKPKTSAFCFFVILLCSASTGYSQGSWGSSGGNGSSGYGSSGHGSSGGIWVSHSVRPRWTPVRNLLSKIHGRLHHRGSHGGWGSSGGFTLHSVSYESFGSSGGGSWGSSGGGSFGSSGGSRWGSTGGLTQAGSVGPMGYLNQVDYAQTTAAQLVQMPAAQLSLVHQSFIHRDSLVFNRISSDSKVKLQIPVREFKVIERSEDQQSLRFASQPSWSHSPMSIPLVERNPVKAILVAHSKPKVMRKKAKREKLGSELDELGLDVEFYSKATKVFRAIKEERNSN